MALPILNTPIFTTTLPSTNEKIEFRAFTVKEEKILLTAFESLKQSQLKEGEDTEIPAEDLDIVKNSIKQVILNCLVNKEDIHKLSYVDFEYLFIQLRSKSINNVIVKKIIDKDDNKEYEIEINLDDIKVKFKEETSNEIELTDRYTIFLKYPSFETLLKIKQGSKDISDIVLLLLDKLYDKETDDVTLFKDTPEKDTKEFINSFPMKALNNIHNFMSNLPVIHLKTSYKKENGETVDIEFNGMYDFFT